MALGNGAPDIFSSLAGIGQDRPELVFGELFGAGVFCTTAVAGFVSITQPFKLMERPFLRDVTFYLLAGFAAFFIFWRQEIRLGDAVGFLVLYVVYIAVVLIGRYIHNRNRQEVPYFAQVCHFQYSGSHHLFLFRKMMLIILNQSRQALKYHTILHRQGTLQRSNFSQSHLRVLLLT